ncbi:MAG TPA: hypothetical protein VEF03_08655 [Candidatus Binataceae bacterium]|nr:hypothetical protein [Candidatus Binataceae bacterium]
MASIEIVNPAMLKLGLAFDGVSIESLHGGHVEFALEDESFARARIDRDSPYRFTSRGEEGVIVHDGRAEHPARIVGPPEFSSQINARGVPLGSIIHVRGLYATVALGGGCGTISLGRACAICRGRELTEHAGEWWPVDEVVEALRSAFEDGAAEFIFFNAGYVPGEDAGVERVRPYVAAAHRYFDATVCVAMHPPATTRAIDLAYAMGVDAICYSAEAADFGSLEKYFPGRAKFFGPDRYFAALEHAARIFPRGAVWSELALDISETESLDESIRLLTSIGVTPLLGVSGLGDRKPAVTDLNKLGAALFERAHATGINMSWTRDMSTALTPLEARHFVPDAPQLPVLIHQLSRNRLGAMATRSLARLRRRLRVRRVSASFDSSHL